MPIILSSTAIEEKNKLATDSVFLVALEIITPGIEEPARVVANSENITWRGETWQAFPFEIEEITETSSGEVPRVELRVGNASRAMEALIHEYDQYCKANGYEPIELHIYVVNTKNLACADPEVEHIFELIQPRTNPIWATFTLGAANPFNRRFPRGRVHESFCRYRFKKARCGYDGAEEECDGTLTRCRVLANSVRFGGAPGAGYGGVVVG